MRQRTDDEILKDLKDWPVRNIYVESGVRLIEQLRQLVAEKETQRINWMDAYARQGDSAMEEITNLRQRVAELEAERDAYERALDSVEDQITGLKETRNRVTAERDEALNKLEMAEACLAGDNALITGLKAERDAALNESARLRQYIHDDNEQVAITKAALHRAREIYKTEAGLREAA